MRETKQVKAARLMLSQAIRFELLLPGDVQASVRGDTGDYTVILREQSWTCTCALGRHSCSHITAVQVIYRAVLPAITKLIEEAASLAEGR